MFITKEYEATTNDLGVFRIFLNVRESYGYSISTCTTILPHFRVLSSLGFRVNIFMPGSSSGSKNLLLRVNGSDLK